MRISIKQLESFLNKSNISYRWEGRHKDIYEIASIFCPVENGFYFLTGDSNFKLEVKNSLFMVSDTYNVENLNNNCYIILDNSRNPQLVFYQFLSDLFKRKSTGQISNLTNINSNVQLGENVQINSFSSLENCKIGDNVIIGSNVMIHSGTEIGNNVVIESGSIIGTQGVSWTWNENQSAKIVQPQLGGVIIDEKSFIGAGTIIVRGSLNENTRIGKNTLMAPGARIGHGTKIGNFVHFANGIVTGGNTTIGDYSFVGSAAVFRPKVYIHAKTIVGAGSLVIKNTSGEGFTLMGVPAKQIDTKANPSGMPKPKN